MKKALLFLFACTLGMNLFAQVLLQQDFSSGQMPPTGWMVFGNTSNWVISQTSYAGGIIPEAKVKNSRRLTEPCGLSPRRSTLPDKLS